MRVYVILLMCCALSCSYRVIMSSILRVMSRILHRYGTFGRLCSLFAYVHGIVNMYVVA